MNRNFIMNLTLLCIVIAVFIFPSRGVWADDITASNPVELKSAIISAMSQRISEYAVTYSGNFETLKTDIETVMNNISEEDQYLYYNMYRYSYKYQKRSDSPEAALSFSFEFFETKQQSDFVASRVSQILKEIITPGMNEYEKEKSIHDWIVRNTSYDQSLTHHSAYSALAEGNKTVCQGYALLAYKMLSEAGIKTNLVSGKAKNEEHMWNMVLIDGLWYHLDCTWDDPIPDEKDRALYDYYNVTDAKISSDHVWTKVYPAANSAFGTVLYGKMSSDSSKASAYRKIGADAGLNSLSFTFEYVKVSLKRLLFGN